MWESETNNKMWKILVLFLVSVFVSGEGKNKIVIKDSNAMTMDRLVWTAGSAVNLTFAPEDAVHCRLKDNKGTTIFDGFGPCRVVLDRVTREHKGSWELFVGAPGTVVVRRSWVDVDVVAAVDPTPPPNPVVTISVESVDDKIFYLILTCSVPEEYQVQSCTFRNPSGAVFIASDGVSQDGYEEYKNVYESYVKDNICKLTSSTPELEREGIWRCAVSTTRGTSHGFVTVTMATLNPLDASMYDDLHIEINLETKYNVISSTEGNAVTMSCSIDAAVRYCYFRAPNGTVFNVGPSTPSADYEYVGTGFDAGECGIKFKNIWISAQGQWSCNVGLKNTSYFEEKRAFFSVYVNERLSVYPRWEGSSVVAHISAGSEVEYCRIVRSDGLGFASEQAPFPYGFDVNKPNGTCTLYIQRPVAEDLGPWTVVVKLSGEDEELSVITNLVPPLQSTRGLSRTASTLLWSLFGTIFVFLIAASFLSKKNREWTHKRAARIRNSFRRQPQPGPQNVTDLPKPVHTDILTDIPRKV